MRTRSILLGALVSLVVGVAPVGAAHAAGSGFTSEAVWNQSTNDWEPAIAAAPNSNYVVELTTRFDGPKACTNCPNPAIIARTSSDGGVTFGADHFICACKGVKTQFDPQVQIATDGTVYAAWLNDYNPGVVFSKSTDHGVTWSPPLPIKGKGLSFSDKPVLTISPTGQNVYIGWNASDSYVSVSHDSGASFGSRVKTNSDSLYWFAEGAVVAPNGNVYYAESAENQSGTGQVKLAVLRSTNGGASWTTTFVDVSEEQPPCTAPSCPPDFLAAQANIAVDGAGSLMLLYSASTAFQAPKDLWVRTSAGGVTWGGRTEVGQNTGDAGFPAIEAGSAAGDFRIAWQDNRNGANAWNTYYRRTTNGGATWGTEVRLSNLGTGAPYKTAAGYAFPYGDYLDMDVSSAGTSLVIWGEGTSYAGPGGTWFARGV